MGAVQQENRARRGDAQHIAAFDKSKLMAGDKIRLLNKVRGTDRMRPEAQMRNRQRSRFVRVIDEVALSMEAGIFSNNLDAVLVGSNRSVGTKTIENSAYGVGRFNGKGRVVCEISVRDIVIDTDREAVLGFRSCQLIEDGFRHCRRKIFRGETVAAANDARHGLPPTRGGGACQRCQNVQIERLAWRAGLFSLLDDCNRPAGLWQHCEKGLGRLSDPKRPFAPEFCIR